MGALPFARDALAADPWPDMANDVRSEARRSWRAYREIAWGRDEIRPVSATAHDFFARGHTFGLTIVEALDTLALMGLEREVARGQEWIERELDVSQNVSINAFEMTIRLVGGLVAAHNVTGSQAIRKRAMELGDRLLPAFDSPSGIPYGKVNLATGAVADAVVTLAQAATHLAEFAALSQISGRARYLRASRRAIDALLGTRSALGLFPTSVDVETGHAVDPVARIDPPVDSFFEALWDGWRLTGDRPLRDAYRDAEAAVVEHLARRRSTGHWFNQADYRSGKATGAHQSELSVFFAGQLAQSGRVRLGARYWKSWRDLYDRYPLLPEVVDQRTGDAISSRNDLRPEFADASLHLWRATDHDRYRRGAALGWRREKRHCRGENGFTILGGDLTPGYWWAENLKYYWLVFSGKRRCGLLSTEGKILRRP